MSRAQTKTSVVNKKLTHPLRRTHILRAESNDVINFRVIVAGKVHAYIEVYGKSNKNQ